MRASGARVCTRSGTGSCATRDFFARERRSSREESYIDGAFRYSPPVSFLRRSIVGESRDDDGRVRWVIPVDWTVRAGNLPC